MEKKSHTIWRGILEEELQPFSSGITEDAVQFTQLEVSDSIRIVIRNNRIHSVTKGKKDAWVWRARGYIALIADALQAHRIPDVDFIIATRDHPVGVEPPYETGAPVFSFCKSLKDKSILIPFTRFSRDDIPFEGRFECYWERWHEWKRWDESIAYIKELNRKYSWEQKEGRCFFIGHSFAWNNIRTNFCLLAKQHPEKLVGYLTQLHEAVKPLGETELKDMIGKWVPMTEYPRYRYLMHLDGNTCSERLRLLLAFHGVPIKHESHLYEFYYPLLNPGQHYVLVREDLSDLLPNIEKLEADPKYAQYVSEEGQRFITEDLNYSEVLWYVKEALTQYAQLMRG